MTSEIFLIDIGNTRVKSTQNTRHKYEKNSYINKNRTRPHRNSKKLQKKFRKYVTSFSVLQKHLLFWV